MTRQAIQRSITCIVVVAFLAMSPAVFAETLEDKVMMTTGAWDIEGNFAGDPIAFAQTQEDREDKMKITTGEWDAEGNFAGDPVAFAQTQEDKVKVSTSEFVMNPGVFAETRKVATGEWDAEGNFAGDPIAFAQTEEDRLKAAAVDLLQITNAAPPDACDSC